MSWSIYCATKNVTHLSQDWIVLVYRLFAAFFRGVDPILYYADFGNSTSIALNALTTISVLVCDIMLVCLVKYDFYVRYADGSNVA